jgi:hypothetical protein
LSEALVRKALKADMMREVLLAANDELEEIKEVENEDWQEEVAKSSRITTALRDRRAGFAMSKEERFAKSQPVVRQQYRDDSLFHSAAP